MIDQNSTHGSRGDREEVCTILPVDRVISGEAHEGLVDERGGIQRVTGTLTAQVDARKLAQFVVDQREKMVYCAVIAVACGAQPSGYF